MSQVAQPGREVSGTRARTRQAILDAAASVCARNPNASLADIAAAADVGRTTVHRYFPDRAHLERSLVEDTYRAIGVALDDAAVDEGSAREALRRLILGLVALDDRMRCLFFHASTSADDESPHTQEPDEFDWSLRRLVERGQASGEFDTKVSPAWIESVLWALLYAGFSAAAEGELPRHGVAQHIIRTLEGGICSPQSGDELNHS